MSGALLEIKWKQGSRFRCDAGTAHTALETLRVANDGDLDADVVLKAATAKRHPLHGEFDWDDKSAAQSWRRKTASKLIASIEVVRENAPQVQSRCYEVAVEPPKEEGEKPRFVYRTIEDILADPVTREKLLMDAIRDAAAYRKRYNALSELTLVFVAMEDLFVATIT